MSRLGMAATLAGALLCAVSVQAADDALTWSVRYMLINGKDDAALYPAAFEVTRDASLRTPEMRELMAEVAWRIAEEKLPAPNASLQMLRVLAAAPEAGRYFEVFQRQRRGNPNKAAKSLHAHYDLLHRRAEGEQFKPGAIDLEALRKQFAATALATKPTMAQAEALAALPTNATMDELFGAVGKPAHVLPREVRISEAPVNIEVRQIWLYYRGIGRITFDFQRESGWHQHLVLIDPMVFEPVMPYRQQAAALGLPDDATLALIQLASGNPSSIKASAQTVHRLENPPAEYLDMAAELLLRKHREIANTGANDAYAWLCNVLAHHGGTRYVSVLSSIEESTTDPKLKRYAGQKLDAPWKTAPRYVAGSLSLEEQARKYPSLYPDITLVRGLL